MGKGKPKQSKTEAPHRSIRTKLRDVKRLLAKDDLPANVRQTQERILEALEGELEEKRTSELERKYAQKYKMVKFFERRKVSRMLAKLHKRKDSGEHVKAADIDEMQKKLDYVVYFPKTEPYISLFPKGGLSEQAKEKQREIVDSIAAAVAAKKLPHASHTFTGERHNDGDKGSGAPGIRPQPIKSKHGKDGRKPAGSALAQDDEPGNAIGDDFFVIDTQGDPSAANRFSSSETAGNGADDNEAPMGTGKKRERTREEVENVILRAKQKNMVVLGMEKEKSPGKKRTSKEAKVGSGKPKKAKIRSDS